ncbi:MAG: hypothetical protein ACFE96_18700 [Candidatus Hermodarchaeota archaeon]
MGDKHLQNFFGNHTTMFVRSTSKEDPFVFLQFISKRSNGFWQNPSIGEGLLLRCNLDQIIMIKDVLKGTFKSWSTNLTLRGRDVNIALAWEDANPPKLWINAANYSKLLNYSQVQLLRSLLKHILKEKVKSSTVTSSLEGFGGKIRPRKEIEKLQEKNNNHNKRTASKNQSVETKYINNTKVTVKKTIKRDVKEITGTIKFQTKKALLLDLSSGEEIWVPKSVIRSLYKAWGKKEQIFYVDSWFFKENLSPIHA